MSTTTDVLQGSWMPGENAVVGYLQPQSYTRRIKLMAINGPSNSRLDIYRGYQRIAAMALSSVFPADIRTYDAPSEGVITVFAGEAATFAWTRGQAGAGQTASVTITSEVS